MDPTVQAGLIDLAKQALPALTAILSGLAVAFVGHRYTKEQSRHAKALDFLERRVTEFYSPMVGCIKSVRALSELRVEVGQASEEAWQEICSRMPATIVDTESLFKPFKGIVGYENEQLYRDILPAYERMVQIFTDNYWLADDEARTYYPELVRFVEIWRRYKADALPGGVLRKLEHSETRLKALYLLLEQNLLGLTAILSHEKAR